MPRSFRAAVIFTIGVIGAVDASPARAWHRLPRGPYGFAEAHGAGIRGVTVGPIESSLHPGVGYGTEASARLLDELALMGVTWISITPFGRIWSLDSTRILMDFEAPYADNRIAVRRMIEQAHERGIRVLVIPHLWVETGGWRGEMNPGSPERWAEYQASYRNFVLAWAADAEAAHADALSIGVECKSWSGRFYPVWSALIRDVRERFSGLLTYSANWDEAEDVIFWHDLDLIGVNAFYPLAPENGASYEEYVRGARRAMAGLRGLAQSLAMPVLLVEIGYTTRRDAAVEPWLWPDDMHDVVIDEHEQARALSALFEAFLPERWVSGFFVWRYYADLDDVSQEAVWGFSPHGKEAEWLLRDVFARQWGADATRTALPPFASATTGLLHVGGRVR